METQAATALPYSALLSRADSFTVSFVAFSYATIIIEREESSAAVFAIDGAAAPAASAAVCANVDAASGAISAVIGAANGIGAINCVASGPAACP